MWKPRDGGLGLGHGNVKKNITTRCGSMLSLGMGLPRKNHGLTLGHYVHVC